MEGLAKLNVDLVNVHAAGGTVMMQRAVEGLRRHNKAIKIIAVTQLTSTSEQQLHEEQNIQTSMETAVLNYASLAQQAGLDGVVCSPLETTMIREHCGDDFLKVTPGIRLANSAKDDQQRITTPEKHVSSVRHILLSVARLHKTTIQYKVIIKLKKVG